MQRRLAWMVLSLGIAAMPFVTSSCGGSDDTPAAPASAAEGTYRGTFVGAGDEQGIVDLTIGTSGTQPASVGVLAAASTTVVTGSITVSTVVGRVTLTGTFDPATGALHIEGGTASGRYLVDATFVNGVLSGQVTTPFGVYPIPFLKVVAPVRVFCGSFGALASNFHGGFNLITTGSLAGAVVRTSGGQTGVLQGSLTGSSLSLTVVGASGGANGTVDSPPGTVSGTFSYAGNTGPFGGSEGLCPTGSGPVVADGGVDAAHGDASGPDASDASSSNDGSGADAQDGSSSSDGSGADAQDGSSSSDGSGAQDGSVPDGASPDSSLVDTGPHDAAVDATVAAGVDSGQTVVDSGPSLDGGSSTPTVTGIFTNAGGTRTCAIAGGSIWCWGYMANGAWGDGTTDTFKYFPTRVLDAAGGAPFVGTLPGGGVGNGITEIAVGPEHTCAIAYDASFKSYAWCWGDNSNGELGDGTTTPRAYPVQVVGLTVGTFLQASSIGAGGFQAKGFTCATTPASQLACWGANQYGTVAGVDPTKQAYVTQPQQALLAPVGGVSVGLYHSCVMSKGNAWCWGLATNGQLGVTSQNQYEFLPVEVLSGPGSATPLANVTQVSAGFQHSCAIAGANAWCWGDTQHGRVGNGVTGQSTTLAVKVLGTGGTGFLASPAQISAGENHTCAAMSGSAVCWGANRVGSLGDGTETGGDAQAEKGYPVTVLSSSFMSPVSASLDYSCGVLSGTAYCWGDNTYQTLAQGHPGPTSVLSPAAVKWF